MKLPLTFDLTPSGKIVPCAEIGEEGYGLNIQYNLQTSFNYTYMAIQYYGEDDTFIYDDDPKLLKYILKFQR